MTGRPSIGARRRLFTLELPTEAPDGFGGVLRSYQPGPRVWGAIMFLSQAERLRADRPEAVATHRVTLPWREDLSGGARLSCGARRFRVRAADDPDGRRRDLVCLVEEVGP